MPDASILDTSTHAAPKSYGVTGAQDVLVKGVSASFDGSAAGQSWVPALQILDPSNAVMGTYPFQGSIADGGSADVSFFPDVASSNLAALAGQQESLSGTVTVNAGAAGQMQFAHSAYNTIVVGLPTVTPAFAVSGIFSIAVTVDCVNLAVGKFARVFLSTGSGPLAVGSEAYIVGQGPGTSPSVTVVIPGWFIPAGQTWRVNVNNLDTAIRTFNVNQPAMVQQVA